MPALTIFPCSSAADTPYGAVNDSFGLTIDRIVWCEDRRNFPLACASHDAHTGNRFRRVFQTLYALVVELDKLFVIAVKRWLVKGKISVFLIDVLEEEGGVDVPLNAPPVWHGVPTLGQFLFVVFVQDVVVLAGPHTCFHPFDTVQSS